MPVKVILSAAHASLTKAMYLHLNVPLDQLPYTAQFELLYREFQEKTNRHEISRNDLWRWLSNARKAKMLPAIRKPKAKAAGGNPPVDAG